MKGQNFAPFQLGVVQFMAFPNTDQDPEKLLASLRALALDDAFSLVELTQMPDAATREKVRALLEAAHLHCAFAATPVILRRQLNPSATDTATRRHALEILMACLDEAITLNARAFVLMSGPFGGDEVSELNAFVQTLNDLCAYAADHAQGEPMWILVEQFDREVDKRALIGPSPLARALAEAVRANHHHFGLLVDLSHLPLLKEAPEDCLSELLGDFVCHVHLGNCVLDATDPLYGDQHPPFGYPKGENDVPQVRVFLEALHYSGYFHRPGPFGVPSLSFEVKPLPEQEPLIVLANAKRVLWQAWRSVGQ
jgi:sugar phosphate isomerase/epimerase